MIQDQAMLARLSISQWGGRRYDKSVSSEVEKAHGANDAGRFNKLLVNKELLDPISKLTGMIRTYHYDKTLPWSDNGDRLLTGKLFAPYTDAIRKFTQQFDTEVARLVGAYPTEVQAARNRLGTMYNAADYPDVSDIKRRFELKVEFMPVPSAGDFRVDVGNAEAERIRQQITESINARQSEAVKECYARVKDVVVRIHERLSIKDAIFKDSLINNARDLMAVLPGLNFTNDPMLDALHSEISAIVMIDPRSLRTNPAARRATADAAQGILMKL